MDHLKEIPLYQTRSGPTVTFMFLDRLQVHADRLEEGTLLEVLSNAYADCYGEALPDKRAVEIAACLPKPKAADAQSSSPPKAPKRGLGSEYMAWMAQLPSDRLCYLLAGFDPAKARDLYAAVDYRIVQDMGEVYVENTWHKIQSSFESSMYGFGGGYNDDKSSSSSGSSSGGDTAHYDLTTPQGKKEAMGALRKLKLVR